MPHHAVRQTQTMPSRKQAAPEQKPLQPLEMLYHFKDQELFRRLCGVADAGIGELEDLLQIRLVPRGHALVVRAPDAERLEFSRRFLDRVVSRAGQNPDFLPEFAEAGRLFSRIRDELVDEEEQAGEGREPGVQARLRETVFTTLRGKGIFARTPNQAAFVHSILNNTVTFALGPAGTGKTFLSIACACRLFTAGRMERIILTRPAVEAGESLGYLPGDLSQKVDPYLRPVYDALYECLGLEKVQELIQSRRIEIAPLAYMRGRTLNRSVIVLDEAQNCTMPQLKMFLTRLGRDSHMCIGGDVTQVDLRPGRSGLLRVMRLLGAVEGIGMVEFGRRDIIRHPLVERIVQAFEDAEEEGEL